MPLSRKRSLRWSHDLWPLGRFGFWRWVHLSFSGHALPAGCGGSHLRLIGSRNCPASAQSTRIRHQFPRNFLPKRTIFYKRRSDPRNTNVSVFVPRENPPYGKATDQPSRWRCSLRKQGFAFYISGGYVPWKSFLACSRIMESSSSDSLGIPSILMSHGARSSP
jgi:hypothetical protein